MTGYTPIRNGILEHLAQRRMTMLEFGLYVFLHMRASWDTGIVHTCALTIAYQLGDPDLKDQVKHCLSRLRRKRYINFAPGDGTRGPYPILIDKYEPRLGALKGTRLNAWKHDQLAVPEYEAVPGECPDGALTVPGDLPEGAPIQEVKEVKKETTTTKQSSQEHPQRKRRSKTQTISAFPPATAELVNSLLNSWPRRQPKDNSPIRCDIALLAERVDELLRQPDVTPTVLTEAAKLYLSESKQFFKAPQFFFGPGNGAEAAPWFGYARMVRHNEEKLEVIS